MATEAILTGEPEFQECQAARLLDISTRTIQRGLLTGDFPKPDGYEKRRGRQVPIWKLSTLQAYRESRITRAVA